MKKILGWIAVIAVVGLCGFGGYMATQRGQQEDDGVLDETAVVETGPLTVQVIETGNLLADTTVEVKSRVSGRVADLLVDEGEFVTQGQLIAVIDPEETELQVAQTEAQLAGAQASEDRLSVELEQRRQTVQTNLDRAESRVEQLRTELENQPRLSQLSIESADTAVNNAQRALDLLVEVTQPNERTSLERELEDARSNLANAESELDRQRNLLEEGFVSQRDVENAELQHELAQTRLRSVQQQIARLDAQHQLQRQRAEETLRQAEAELERANVNVFQDDVKREQYEQALADLRDARVALKDVEALQASRRQQSASVRQTQISLNDRRRELNETEIRAPISGIVTQRLVQEGELVANLSSFSAGTPLYRIDDRSQMIVELGVNEIDVAKLEVGMGAEIEVDAFPNETFPGTVRKIAPVNTSAGANPGAQDPVVRYEVEIALDESDDRLKGGMSATCTMTVVDLEDVLRIPGEYLGREGDITYVVLENGDRVDVVVGESSGAFVQIIDGVSEGTEIQRPEFTGPDRRGVMQFGPEEDEEPEAEEE